MVSNVEEFEALIDAALQGDEGFVRDFGGDLGEKILKLSSGSEAEALDRLKRWVDMSVIANRSVGQIARMSKTMRDSDVKTQAMAAAIEQMAATIESVSNETTSVADEIRETSETAKMGRQGAYTSLQAMKAIAGSTSEVANEVNSLSDSASKIDEIVELIELIARQTDMLAINASVEAARAGSAGKGFAVVANEVKALSGQTSAAAVDIRKRIAELRGGLDSVFKIMSQNVKAVDDGQRIINELDKRISDVQERVNSVNESTREIAGSLEQQRSATAEISSSVEVVSAMSARNVTLIDQAIEMLESSEAPIVESINDLTAKAGLEATVYAAKSDHMIWMRKLFQMLVGRAKLNPDELADHHGCRLGKWYDQQKNPRFVDHPAWHALLEPHAGVHQAGIAAARAYSVGDLDGAI